MLRLRWTYKSESAKAAKGEPFRIMVIFSVVTANLSALLDNVTIVLLIAPVTIFICQTLELDVIPYLITEVLASNIGGTATLIGGPPNIMIASKAHLDFMAFIYHLMPVVIIIMVLYIVTLKLVFGKRLTVKEELRQRMPAKNRISIFSCLRPLDNKKILIILLSKSANSL